MNINAEQINDPIDQVKLDKIKRVLAHEFDAAFDSFIKQAQIYSNAIQSAIEQRRFGDAMGVAHKLKSSSGLYGFWKVSKLSNDIERAPMTANIETLLKMQADLDAALQEAIISLGEYR